MAFSKSKPFWILLIILTLTAVGLLILRNKIANNISVNFNLSKASTHTFVWNDGFTESGNASTPWIPKTVDRDVVITGASVNISNIPLGVVFDLSINESYQWGSDIINWHATRQATAANWNAQVDLSGTPIFVPAGSGISCQSSAYYISTAITTAQKKAIGFSCSVTYQDYVPGTPRFKVLRFPYTDQQLVSNHDLAYSPYQSTALFPYHVRGFTLFDSFDGQNTGASSTPCLEWRHSNGTLVNQSCLPIQTISPTQDYDSSSDFINNLDWLLSQNDLLTASCHSSTQSIDCAIMAFVEIPSTLVNGPDNVYSFYGDLPASTLNTYCTTYVDHLPDAWYCPGGQPGCDPSYKIALCNSYFPTAACVASNTCTGSYDSIHPRLQNQ